MSPGKFKTARKMFPDQNIHYNRNYHYGYQGLNFVNGSEYNNRFKYDQAKAKLVREANSPNHYKRVDNEPNPVSQPRVLNKAETQIFNPPSLPSQDLRRVNYPESVPPLDEMPPEPKPDQNYEPRKDSYNPAIEPPPMVRQEMPQDYNPDIPRNEMLPPEPHPVQVQRQPEFENDIVTHQPKGQEPDRESRASSRRAQAQVYKDELDKQIQAKNQKRVFAQSVKQEERQKIQDWQSQIERQEKAKADERNKIQESTRKFYEAQMQEKEGGQSRHLRRPMPKMEEPNPII